MFSPIPIKNSNLRTYYTSRFGKIDCIQFKVHKLAKNLNVINNSEIIYNVMSGSELSLNYRHEFRQRRYLKLQLKSYLPTVYQTINGNPLAFMPRRD